MKKPLVIPRELKIRVTRKDIDTGTYSDGQKCAVAKALKANIGGHPDVENYQIFVDFPGGVRTTYAMPEKAVKFIEDFDEINEIYSDWKSKIAARRKLKPFTFVAKLDEAEYHA